VETRSSSLEMGAQMGACWFSCITCPRCLCDESFG